MSCAPRRLQGFVPDHTLADVCCTHGHCHAEENVWQVCLLTEAHGPLEPPTPPLSCPLASLMRPRCTLKCGACARGRALRPCPGASGEAAHDKAGTTPSYSSPASHGWIGCHLWQPGASYSPTPGEAGAHGPHPMPHASPPGAPSWDWSSGRGACEPPGPLDTLDTIQENRLQERWARGGDTAHTRTHRACLGLR